MNDKVRVLVELRPALDGFSGIPQETRLLFRSLIGLQRVVVTGLLQPGGRDIPSGLAMSAVDTERASPEQINSMSRVVVAFTDDGHRGVTGTVFRFVQRELRRVRLRLSVLIGTSTKLGSFFPEAFEDFVWRTFFSKTLPIEDRHKVLKADYKVLPVTMATLHRVKLSLFGLFDAKRFKKIDTGQFDIFISQTPFPGFLSKNTRLVVRYHDAIPVFMPHTIKDRAFHQTAHYDALLQNVRAGAYFACVSAATKSDLLKIFPEIGDRAVVIHNTVSPIYLDEDSSADLVGGIVSSRLFRPLGKKYKALNANQIDMFMRNRLNPAQEGFNYLLMVSTVEPRKNHASLVAAWELLRSRYNLALKLVFVGDLGWEYGDLIDSLMPWMERGEFFQLCNVPAPDLRVLYKHAKVTICPSYAEGFDYSGVESMLSGGVVAASDIPVHREVYDDASIYFNPYSTESIANGILEAIALRDNPLEYANYRQRASRVSAQYTAGAVVDKWDEFIQMVGRASPEAIR